MKELYRKGLALLLAAASLLSIAGCNRSSSSDSTAEPPTESVDEERTQLYVFNTNFGSDSSWLMEAKKRFEALHAEDVWEDGRKGVQVVVRNTSKTAMDVEDTMLTDREEVYFTQESDYRYLVSKGLLADITLAVTKQLEGEENSIASKLTNEQRSYYSMVTATLEIDSPIDVRSYYALPNELSQVGIVYNVDLFEENGYYFAAQPQANGSPFVASATDKRSPGPDGKEGSADDGLPATYQQFFTLCEYIDGKDQTPITWGGASYDLYLQWLTNALAVDYNGYDQSLLQYTFNGTATNLGSIHNGGFKEDEEDTLITEENGYLLSRSAGNYYSLDFLKKLVSAKFCGASAFKKNRSQEEAVKEFLWQGEDGKKSDVAMLVDGSWWESGASKVLAGKNTEDETTAIADRRFGWMPLPKATEDKAGMQTSVDCLGSMAFIKSNVAEWKQPLAEDFLRFIYSDAELRAYTRETGALKAIGYTLTQEDRNALSYFGNTLVKHTEESRILYPYSDSPLFVNNERFFSVTERWNASFLLGSTEQYPAFAFKSKNMSVIDYFNGMLKYAENGWGTLKHD